MAARGGHLAGAAGDDDEYYYYYDYDEEEGMEVEEEDDEAAFGEGLEDESSAAPVFDDRAVSWAITKESLLAAQKEDLSTVMNLLAIKERHARALLIHHRWKLESIYDHLDQKGRDRLFLEAGIILQENRSVLSAMSLESVTCNVCFDDVSLSAASTMDCGHCFCNDCWTEHFLTSISSGIKQIRCMAFKCHAICDEDIVRRLVSKRSPDAANRFEHFLLESYIEDNDSVKWCPSTPHCGNAVRVKGDKYCEVECLCGVEFCFNCALEAHSPCPCVMWNLWAKKCSDESENANWIISNTKSCPKCYKPIVKEGGCNLVKCRCGQYLCWLCGAATGRTHTWNSIEGHSCNRFTKEEQKKIEDAKRKIQRYIHYYNRYKAHGDSYKTEKKLEESIDSRIKQLDEKGFQNSLIIDGSWMRKSLKTLLRSRQILSYSYAFAFCMFGDELPTYELEEKYKAAKQNLFEDQQEQLESNVEKLSMFLAHDVSTGTTEEEILDIRLQLMNSSKIVGKYCTEMYKCIQDELLPLLKDSMFIAPYRPDGYERAKELPAC